MSSFTIDYDKTEEDSKAVFYSVLITSILLAVVIVGSYYYFKASLSAENNRKQLEASRSRSLVKLEKSYQKNLNSLTWINQSKGQVRIPIDMAMNNVVKDYNN